jgi:hypothetical protein
MERKMKERIRKIIKLTILNVPALLIVGLLWFTFTHEFTNDAFVGVIMGVIALCILWFFWVWVMCLAFSDD